MPYSPRLSFANDNRQCPTPAQSNSDQENAILDEAYTPGATIHTECLANSQTADTIGHYIPPLNKEQMFVPAQAADPTA